MPARFDLSGRRLLITGAGRGLGRSLAVGAARAGARVAALDVDGEALEETCRTGEGHVLPYVVDVADRLAFEAAAAAFAGEAGAIDAVVNNAMLIRYEPLEALSEEMLDRMLAIGVKGAVWGAQALVRHKAEGQDAALLTLTSPVGERGYPGTLAYAMVKGALASFTRTLSAELGPKGIRVNAVAPGSIPTPGAIAITPKDEYERRAGSIPLRRLGSEEECTAAMLFLLSDAAAFITGETLHIDGGIAAKG
ncbi:MAG TPA: SDR family oxidoreductase [Sphingomonadaceae bacterium]|nr:SDR family oxidoreductase [Sphingomonadaceae bacterium]